MSAFSITAANVLPLTNTKGNVYSRVQYFAAADLSAFTPVYISDTTNYLVSAAKADTVPHATIYGVVLTATKAGQPVVILQQGKVNPGFASGGGASVLVVLSGSTAGAVCPAADITTGWIATIVGVMDDANTLNVDFLTTYNVAAAAHA